MDLYNSVYEVNVEFANKTVDALREFRGKDGNIISAFEQINTAYTEAVKKILKITVDYTVCGDRNNKED